MEQLLDSAEASSTIKVSERTLADWRHKGIGPPYVRVGPRQVRYRPSDLEAWLKSQTQPTSAA